MKEILRAPWQLCVCVPWEIGIKTFTCEVKNCVEEERKYCKSWNVFQKYFQSQETYTNRIPKSRTFQSPNLFRNLRYSSQDVLFLRPRLYVQSLKKICNTLSQTEYIYEHINSILHSGKYLLNFIFSDTKYSQRV